MMGHLMDLQSAGTTACKRLASLVTHGHDVVCWLERESRERKKIGGRIPWRHHSGLTCNSVPSDVTED